MAMIKQAYHCSSDLHINSDLYFHKVTIKSRKERKPNRI